MEQIVQDAIADLALFEVKTADDALWLLSTWVRREELSVADIRAIVAHYRTAPVNLAVTPVNPNLTATDPAPAGAVVGVDRDGDTWKIDVGGWHLSSADLHFDGEALVRKWGPIEWFDADGNLIGTSHPDGRS